MRGQLLLRLTAFHSAVGTRNRDLIRLTTTTRFLGTRIDAAVRHDAFWTPPLPRVAALGFETRFFHVYTEPYRALRRTLFLRELHTDLDSDLTSARFAVSRPLGTTLQTDVL